MEAFKVLFQIQGKNGETRTFVRKTFSTTGWEAAEQVRIFIQNKVPGIKRLKFLRWEVLNPFMAHFH